VNLCEARSVVPLRIAPQAPIVGSVVHTLDGTSMGTTWQVRCVGAAHLPLGALRRGIEHELHAVVAQMSTWDTRSCLSRFNQAPADTWCALPAEAVAVLRCALRVAHDSGGACDPTAGALVNLWGFGPGAAHTRPGFRAPDAMAIDAARARCGWLGLQFDAREQRVRQPGGMYLDLSAVAKGFAVDQMAAFLHRAGIADHLVEVGGELRGSGLRPDGQPWWVALETPPGAALAPTRIALHGLSVATSGDYRRCFDDAAGVRRSHTIDPRSGWPVAHGLASVSVLHAQCMWADAWSTALTVLGLDDGWSHAERHGLAAHFVIRRADGGFDERVSPAWAEMAA
jgi:thiamine biosynthesis lipoprotein